LQYKQMGRTGLKVSAMSIGTMFFGTQVSEEEAVKTLDLAFDKGINMFDTADAYGLGKSEEIVGKAIKNKRQSWFWLPKSATAAAAPQRFRPVPRAYYQWS